MATPTRKIRIIDQAIIPATEAGRIGKKDVVITYQDESLRTRIVTIPYEKLEGKSDEEQWAIIQEYIKKAELERRKFIGREFTI